MVPSWTLPPLIPCQVAPPNFQLSPSIIICRALLVVAYLLKANADVMKPIIAMMEAIAAANKKQTESGWIRALFALTEGFRRDVEVEVGRISAVAIGLKENGQPGVAAAAAELDNVVRAMRHKVIYVRT